MLHLYLSLEKTRFGDSFEYNIYLEETIDADEIKIPNLMVQPFVENAIWHGLMHKEGNREIAIHFRLSGDKMLVCEIVDNGIGRHKSEEIKKSRLVDLKHQSKGMQLIKDKSELLKQQFGNEVFIEINDVLNDANEVSGTSVLIKISLTDQF
jgi:LytS/YehU family sensor histidine kinase